MAFASGRGASSKKGGFQAKERPVFHSADFGAHRIFHMDQKTACAAFLFRVLAHRILVHADFFHMEPPLTALLFCHYVRVNPVDVRVYVAVCST